MSYTDPPIPADETALAEDIIARYPQIDPTWEVGEFDVETVLAEAAATPFATAIRVLIARMRGTYAEVVGERVAKVTRNPETSAIAKATLKIDTTAGFVLPAGTEFGLTLDGELEPFVTVEPVEFETGQDTATDVSLVAVDPGPDANRAGAPIKTSAARVNAAACTITSAASGGAWEEDEDEYLDRISERSERVSFIPASAPQWAAVIREDPAVDRCAYFNRRSPTTWPAESPGDLIVVPIDAAGAGFDDDSEPMARFLALAEVTGDDRPVQAAVHFMRPESVDIAAALTVVRHPDYSEDETRLAIQAAVGARLSKALWDYDATAPGRWRPTTTSVTAFDVSDPANALVQVTRVTAATVNGGASVALAGVPLALPNLTGVEVTFA